MPRKHLRKLRELLNEVAAAESSASKSPEELEICFRYLIRKLKFYEHVKKEEPNGNGLQHNSDGLPLLAMASNLY